MVNDIAVQDFVNAIKETPTDTNTTYQATVSRIDDEGVVWVCIHGSEKETPTASTSAEVKRGDSVTVQWRSNKLYIGGNYSNPSAGVGTVMPSVDFVTELIDKDITVNSINAATGFIGELTSKSITAQDITADHAMIKELDVESMAAAVAYIGDLTAGNIEADDIIADHATIDSLDTNYAHISSGVIDNAKIGYADVNGLNANYAHISNGVIDNAKIGYADVNDLNAHYASINLANVNNAWIQNGVVKDAAISDAQIADVSANKLTAGTIDASDITVTNLNASNITAGSITVDGITIDVENNEATIDGGYIEDGTITMNGLAQSVQNAIDGAIETFTGSAVPTLNNPPASSWTTTKLKDSHIGDIYYVINAGQEADGYCYRFAKSGNTYSWVLIQDSDVTAALSRLTTAEGKIEGLETFESETSSWITDTDEELSSIKTNVTSLSGRMDTAEGNIQQKVDTSTFNTLSQTVGENSSNITTLTTITENNGLTTSTNITNTVNNVSQTASGNSSKISQLTTTLGTNADGTTKAGDIVHQVSDIDQDLDSIATRVSKTEVRLSGQYATSSTGSSTTAKTATITPTLTGYTLEKGAIITVKFTNANTNSAPTLNVNSTGAKAIRTYSGGTLSEAEYKWPAGATMSFVYDGSYWRIQDSTELTRLSTAESTITQQATAIEAKVSKDGVIASINASVEEQGGSAVLISADKVNIEGAAIFGNYSTTAQMNTAIGNAVDGIEIGGRNLAPMSHWFGGTGRSVYNENIVDTFSTTARGFALCHTSDILAPLVPSSAGLGEDIVVSFDFKIDSGGDASHTIMFYAYQNNGISINITNAVSDIGVLTSDEKKTTWTRVNRVTQARNWGDNGSYSIGSIYLYDNTGNNNFSVRNVKIERGNKATDFTPAPEDTAATATNYITQIDNNGIRVHPRSTENNSVVINADGMEVFKGGTATANSVAFYGDTARIGKASNSHLNFDYHSMQFVDKDGTVYVNVSDLRGTDGTTTLTEDKIANGTDTDFGVSQPIYLSQATVKVNGSSVTPQSIGTYSVTLSSAPANNAVVSITYVTTSTATKAYTFGQRASNYAVGAMSFASGMSTVASSGYSHAEGYRTIAAGSASHAEGNATSLGALKASGVGSHAEGVDTLAVNYAAHAEGQDTVASGSASHAGGVGTTANGWGQTAIGRYNVPDTSSLFIVGDGTSSSNSNGFKIDSSGNAHIKGDVYIGCNADSTGGTALRQVFTTSTSFSSSGVYSYINVALEKIRTDIATYSNGIHNITTGGPVVGVVLSKYNASYWSALVFSYSFASGGLYLAQYQSGQCRVICY